MTTKKLLLAGIAVGALAMAGSASALTLSGSTIAAKAVDMTPYKVANEAKTLASTTSAVFDAHVSTGNQSLNSGQYLVTYTISGAAFQGSVAAPTYKGTGVDSSGNPTMTPAATTAVTSTASSTTVSYVVTVGASDSISDIIISPTLTGVVSGTPVTLTESISLASNSSLPIDGGPASATVISFANAFVAGVGANAATNAVASIASNFTLFASNNSSATIGTISYGLATGTVYKDLGGTQVSSGDITGATVTLTGSLGSTEVAEITAGGTPYGSTTLATSTTPASSTITLSGSSGSGVQTSLNVVLVQTASSTTATKLAQSSYSVVVTPTLSAAYTSPAMTDAATVPLGSVSFEGTNFLAPWMSGSSTNGTVSTIRLSNSGTSTGPVTLSLTSAVTVSSGTTSTYSGANSGVCTSTTLSKLASIPGNSELLVTSSDLATCFGAFTRGDVLVTVQASPANLTAKARIVNASTGIASEVTLNNTSGFPNGKF